MPSRRPRSAGSASVCSRVVIEVFIARKEKLMPTSATSVSGSRRECASVNRLTAYTAPPTSSSRRRPEVLPMVAITTPPTTPPMPPTE